MNIFFNKVLISVKIIIITFYIEMKVVNIREILLTVFGVYSHSESGKHVGLWACLLVFNKHVTTVGSKSSCAKVQSAV